LHIHKHLIDQVDLITILREFIAVKDRRINILERSLYCNTVTSVVTRDRSHIPSSEF